MADSLSDPNRCPGCGYYGCDCECPRKLTPEEAIREIKDQMPEHIPCGWSGREQYESLLEEIEAILDRTELPAIERAEPGIVTPVEWPTEPGVWARYGDTYLVNRETWVWIDGTWHGKYGRGCDALHGGWVKCTVTVPPIREPEPIPEKPLRLLARGPGLCWCWLIYDVGVFWLIGEDESVDERRFTEINADASDPEAVELWRQAREGE